MSRYDYLMSIELNKQDPSFASLVMACVRKADDINMSKLERCWPEIVAEIRARYNAPGGVLTGE